MTLAEWTAQVTRDLSAAGYAVQEYQGFPLVKCPRTIAEGARLLKLQLSLPADRRIYAEGMLFVPAGLGDRE